MGRKKKYQENFLNTIANQVLQPPAHPAEDQDTVGRYKCSYCPRTFTTGPSARRHEIIHSDNPKPFECNICGARFGQSYRVVVHKKRFHESGAKVHWGDHEHKCPDCPAAQFKTAKQFQEHVWKEHREREPRTGIIHGVSCKICPMTFQATYHFREHMKNHAKWFAAQKSGHPPPRYKITKKIQDIYKRIAKRTTKACCKYLRVFDPLMQLPKCKQCGSEFPTEFALQGHARVKHPHPPNESASLVGTEVNRSYQCEYCTTKLDCKKRLESHIQAKHMKVVAFESKYCSRRFRYWRTCETHELRHETRGICAPPMRNGFILARTDEIRTRTCELCGEQCVNSFFHIKHFLEKHRRHCSVKIQRLVAKPVENSESGPIALCTICGNQFKASELKLHLITNPATCGAQSTFDIGLNEEYLAPPEVDTFTLETAADVFGDADCAFDAVEVDEPAQIPETPKTPNDDYLRKTRSKSKNQKAKSKKHNQKVNTAPLSRRADENIREGNAWQDQDDDFLPAPEVKSEQESDYEAPMEFEEDAEPVPEPETMDTDHWSHDEDQPATPDPESAWEAPVEAEVSNVEFPDVNQEEEQECKLCNAPPMAKAQLTQHIHDQHLKPVSVSMNRMLFQYVNQFNTMSIVRPTDDSFNIPWYICGKCGRAFAFKLEWHEHKVMDCPRKYDFVHRDQLSRAEQDRLPPSPEPVLPGGWYERWDTHLYPEPRPHPSTMRGIIMVDGVAFCRICLKAFTSCRWIQRDLDRHQVIVPPEGQWKNLENGRIQCTTCDKVYGPNHKKVLNAKSSHYTRFHSSATQKFICEQCGAQLSCQNTLDAHVRLHTGERPYLCDLCPMRFSSGARLSQHKRDIHLNSKTYMCEICGKTLKSYCAYHFHKNAHHRPKKTEKVDVYCPECGKKFGTAGHLRHHRIKVHGVPLEEVVATADTRVRACSMCPKVFSDCKSLQRHEITAHAPEGLKPKFFECKLCDQAFSLIASMRSHLRRKHTEQIQPPELLQENAVTLPSTGDDGTVAEKEYTLETYFVRNKWSKFRQNDQNE